MTANSPPRGAPVGANAASRRVSRCATPAGRCGGRLTDFLLALTVGVVTVAALQRARAAPAPMKRLCTAEDDWFAERCRRATRH